MGHARILLSCFNRRSIFRDRRVLIRLSDNALDLDNAGLRIALDDGELVHDHSLMKEKALKVSFNSNDLPGAVIFPSLRRNSEEISCPAP